MIIRVTHLATTGGRLDGTEKVLWTQDMTEDEYDRYLDRKQKQLEQRRAERDFLLTDCPACGAQTEAHNGRVFHCGGCGVALVRETQIAD